MVSPGPNNSGPIVDISIANHVYARGQPHIAMVTLKTTRRGDGGQGLKKHAVSTY